MPSFSRPNSTRILFMGDWYYSYQAAGGGFHHPAAGNDSQIALYNDSQQGEFLWVYGIQSFIQIQEYFWYFIVAGTIGSFFGNCFPVVSGNAQPRGQIYTGEVPSIVPGDVSFPIVSQFQSSIPSSSAAGPLAVLKPGFSLVAEAADDFAASFNYLVLSY